MTKPTLQAALPLSRQHAMVMLTGLYIAQGLPFGFFALALPVLLREAGWSLTAIGTLQLLALPWALKFLWAPVLDHYGSRRAWLLGLQCSAIAAALLLALVDLRAATLLMFSAVLLFNLIAASQDVVTDGLAVRLLDARERGLANAIQVGAYRLGMVLGGGVLLWVFARTSWPVMFMTMAALLVLTTLPVLTLRESTRLPRVMPAGGLVLAMGWWRRATTPGMLTIAGLIFCYRFGDQLLSSLVTPFLVDKGLDKATIALMKGGVGSASSIAGALLGGWLVLALGRRRALLGSGLAQAACFGLYIAVAMDVAAQDPLALLWTATVLEGVVGTMATVALFTLMMDASDPDHAGTDYTLLASVVVAVGSIAGIAAGILGDAFGYAATFTLATVLAAVGTVFVVQWLNRHPTHPRVAQAWG